MKAQEDLEELYRRGFRRDVLERNPHLLGYVLRIRGSLGAPQFLDALDDDLKYADAFNVIYPVGDPIFIHAFTARRAGPSDHVRKYYIVEPEIPSKELVEAVEEVFADVSGDYEAPEDPEERRETIERILDKILVPVNREKGYYRVRGRRVEVSAMDIAAIRYYTFKEKVGTSVIEPFLRDPYIEDVSCPGAGCIYLVHKIFGPMEASACFKDDGELNRFIIRLSERIGKPVSRARPIVDAVLPDGSRVNIVYGEDVSLKGSNFTIRKFSNEPISVVSLIRWGTMSPEIAAYLWMALREQMNIWICGETASGKTTTLNAIAAFIPPEYKVISIEDTAEVNLPHENWVRELTRDTGSPESSITMFDLLRAALRQRPNYIIVGEVRGREGNIAFQAMQSVAWYTPIMIRRNGSIEVRAIGDVVDRYFSEGEEGSKLVSDLEVLTISRTMEVGFARVSRVIRHWYKGKLYRVKLSDGSYVDVTGSHSLIAYNPVRGLYEVKPTELYRGDWLLTSSLPTISSGEPPESPELLGYLCGASLALGKLEGDGDAYSLTLRVSRGREVPLLLKLLSLARDHIEISTGGGGIKVRAPTGSTIARSMACARGSLPLETSYSRSFAYSVVRALEELCGGRCSEKVIGGARLSDIAEWLKRIHKLDDLEPILSRRDAGYICDGIEIGRGIRIVSVVSVEEVEYKGYVYDLSVPGDETFLGGSKPVLLHNTGHGVMSTFHAANIQRLIQRLTGSPIEVPPSYLDNLNIAVFQSAVYDKRGRLMRRVIEVDEIIGYDPDKGRVAYLPTFTWDPGKDTHIYMGRGSSFILEHKIALRRGIPKSQIKKIYDELGLRAGFLELLAKNRVTGYWRVWRAIRATYTYTLEELVAMLERGDLSFIEGVSSSSGKAGKA